MSSFGSRKWYFIHAGHSQAHLVHGRNLIKSGVQLVLGTVCPGLLQKKKCFLKILQPESAFEESEHTGDPFPSYPPPSLAVDGVCKSNVQQSSQEMLLKTSICLEWAQHAILTLWNGALPRRSLMYSIIVMSY